MSLSTILAFRGELCNTALNVLAFARSRSLIAGGVLGKLPHVLLELGLTWNVLSQHLGYLDAVLMLVGFQHKAEGALSGIESGFKSMNIRLLE